MYSCPQSGIKFPIVEEVCAGEKLFQLNYALIATARASVGGPFLKQGVGQPKAAQTMVTTVKIIMS